MTYLRAGKTSKKTPGSTARITRIGIKSTRELQPRNHAGISMTRSVMSYLLDRHQKSNWCRQKKFSVLHHHGNGRQVVLDVENVCYDVI